MLLVGLSLSACQDDLYTGLSQRAANEMIAVLAENDIKASRAPGESGSYKIRVSDSDQARAVRVLQSAGYPRDSYRSIVEIFPGDGIIVTPFEQRARMSFALSQELSRTITDINGVVSARVHVMLPEADSRSLGRPNTPSASVVVHQTGVLDPNELSQRIRVIVANAVANLPQKSVSVLVFQARNGAGGGMDPAFSTGSAGPVGGNSPFGLTLWILAALTLVAGLLVVSQRRRLPR